MPTPLQFPNALSLSEAQLRQFVSHGYVVLKTDFTHDFHDAMSRRIQEVMKKEGNPGNNILPRVPEVQEVFKHPVIRGALESVLGPAFIMHPHRHCHFTEPGRKVQSWHKDSYWGHAKMRNHHPWWAMIFYYYHAVDEPLGPSGLLAGTQYYHDRNIDPSEKDVHLLGEAGTFALIHYDLWHRGNANVSEHTRSMLKFQFVRMRRPAVGTAPAAGQVPAWQPMNGDGPPNSHETIWRHQWQWLHGATGVTHTNAPADFGKAIAQLDDSDRHTRLRAADALGSMGAAAADAIPALATHLADDFEPVALNAAYGLAGMGAAGVAALLSQLRSDDKATSRNAAYGLSAAGGTAVASLIETLSHAAEHVRGHAAFALGELGLAGSAHASTGVEALSKLARDSSEWVRRTTAEALGTIDVHGAGSHDQRLETLCLLLNDEDGQARFESALALARIGPDATAAIPALGNALKDENRYVRANAVDALNRIGTLDAQRILIDHLLGARWCYSTTAESLF